MSLARVTLALALAGAALAPAAANAYFEVCAQPTSNVYVCHAPERPGCVHGYVNRLAFQTAGC